MLLLFYLEEGRRCGDTLITVTQEKGLKSLTLPLIQVMLSEVDKIYPTGHSQTYEPIRLTHLLVHKVNPLALAMLHSFPEEQISQGF